MKSGRKIQHCRYLPGKAQMQSLRDNVFEELNSDENYICFRRKSLRNLTSTGKKLI